jgi:hypothetical protein
MNPSRCLLNIIQKMSELRQESIDHNRVLTNIPNSGMISAEAYKDSMIPLNNKIIRYADDMIRECVYERYGIGKVHYNTVYCMYYDKLSDNDKQDICRSLHIDPREVEWRNCPSRY